MKIEDNFLCIISGIAEVTASSLNLRVCFDNEEVM